jgi:hypothetical protein
MNFHFTHRPATDCKNDYATSQHFCELFTEDANSLYLLSFLLTADHRKAEQCFVAGLDDCVKGVSIFREWSRSWARRVIAQNAIRTVAPHVGSTRKEPAAFRSAGEGNLAKLESRDTPFAAVLALGDLERFVYVLSVLEKYSDQDCATLLSISQRDVREGRVRALQQIADSSQEAAAPLLDGAGTGTN